MVAQTRHVSFRAPILNARLPGRNLIDRLIRLIGTRDSVRDPLSRGASPRKHLHLAVALQSVQYS